jgi:hypothetical protein
MIKRQVFSNNIFNKKEKLVKMILRMGEQDQFNMTKL